MEAIYNPSNVTPAFPRPFSETIACAASDLHVEASSRITSRVSSVIGCKIDQSPEGIALGFLNSGAIALGMKPQFKFGYYAGTTGEYDLGAV